MAFLFDILRCVRIFFDMRHVCFRLSHVLKDFGHLAKFPGALSGLREASLIGALPGLVHGHAQFETVVFV